MLSSYFSRTRGTKMDTKVMEHKQGADTTADLLPQQPQMKDVEQKLSAASSDEEKLAAGISMI